MTNITRVLVLRGAGQHGSARTRDRAAGGMAASPRGDEELQHAEIGTFASGPLDLAAVSEREGGLGTFIGCSAGARGV